MRLVSLFVLALVLLSAPAHAQGRGGGPGCSVSSTGVSFGVYDVFSGSPLDSTGTITFDCTGNPTITIKLSTGGSGSYTSPPRRMSGAVDNLDYNLYLDASRTQVWGDGTSGTTFFSANKVKSRTVTIYGRVYEQQDVTAGSYSDTITVTIEF